jgi:hypothetical protein
MYTIGSIYIVMILYVVVYISRAYNIWERVTHSTIETTQNSIKYYVI